VSSCCVTYEIHSGDDGAIAISVTTTTGMTVKRRDFASFADAQVALEDLRAILAAQDLDLVQARGPALT
jgi:hypothetical protein